MRKNCKFPEDCGGGKRGLCRKCTDPAVIAAAAERLQRWKEDPAFEEQRKQRALAGAARFRSGGGCNSGHFTGISADPVIKAKQLAALRACEPQRIAASRAAATRRRGYELPPELVKTVAKWKRQGLTPDQIKTAVERIAAKAGML